MSLVRAFTTRRNKQPNDITISSPLHIGRAASQRAGRPVVRAQISSPVALVSTSNALLNNATAIAGAFPIENRAVSSGSSASSISGEDSDASTSNSIHSRDTATDASSVDERSPISEPGENHLSCYFKPAVDTQSRSSVTSSPTSSARPSLDNGTPRLPQRVPSHSKKAHESLHRKRSIQRMMSPPPAARPRFERTRDSTDMFSANLDLVETPKANPFGMELAQLDEVAEEFGNTVRDAADDVDVVVMQSQGLAKFQAVDYMSEINDLVFETYMSDESDASSDSGAESDLGGWI